jgi:hypothetical protein
MAQKQGGGGKMTQTTYTHVKIILKITRKTIIDWILHSSPFSCCLSCDLEVTSIPKMEQTFTIPSLSAWPCDLFGQDVSKNLTCGFTLRLVLWFFYCQEINRPWPTCWYQDGMRATWTKVTWITLQHETELSPLTETETHKQDINGCWCISLRSQDCYAVIAGHEERHLWNWSYLWHCLSTWTTT